MALLLIGLRFENWALSHDTNQAGSKGIIGSRIHICTCEDGNEKCNCSNLRDKLSVSFQPTQRSTIPSIPSVTSSQEKQYENTETALSRSGRLRP